MNPLGPPDSYLADVLMSTLVYSVATVSALVLLEVVVYVAMVVELLRGNGGRSTTCFPRAAAPPPPGTPRADLQLLRTTRLGGGKVG
jgi:hypothetical protein